MINRIHRLPLSVPALLIAAGFLGGLLVYARHVETNPPGFYLDEASIAYNAWQIATTGQDEHGIRWPLYFRAFGEYKNPLYIYALAAVFTITGPSVRVARTFSAAIGALGLVMIGIAAASIARRREVGVIAWLLAVATAWLFALSRVTVEVAMYPLAVAAFVIAASRASTRTEWRWADRLALAATMAVLTYAYSIGRLLGPLLAGGLVLLANRRRLLDLAWTWALYAILLIPLLVFIWRHPGALNGRFNQVSYLAGATSVADAVQQFLAHYLANLNLWSMAVEGDPNERQIASLIGVGLIPFTVLTLSIIGGAVMIVRAATYDAWSRFVLYAFAASVVPASLTTDDRHMLRLAAIPVWLIVLAVPPIAYLVEHRHKVMARAALVLILALALSEGIAYARVFAARVDDPRRRHIFDADYPTTIFAAAVRQAGTPPRIHIADAPSVPGYMQAFWNATLRSLATETFVLLPPDVGAPDGALVIATEKVCLRCEELASTEPYTLYIARGPVREYRPLPESDRQVELHVGTRLERLTPRQQAVVSVRLRNMGHSVWLAGERTSSPSQVAVANHWLDSDGRPLINDDGRAPLVADLAPGETMTTHLVVNAPARPGRYIMEVDVLQEGVKWFGETGSPTIRIPVDIR